VVKREKASKTTQQNRGLKLVQLLLLGVCLRRERVGRRVYIHEWQSRAVT